MGKKAAFLVAISSVVTETVVSHIFYFVGDYTLDINPVLLEDDAVFQCQVGAADGVAPIRSRDAVLTVNVPPERPIIINGDTLRTTEDREVEIKCVSRGGKPAATVSSDYILFCY